MKGPAPCVADRLFVVLETCAASTHALSLAELAAATGLPKSTLHRMCWKLVELGALEQRPSGFQVDTKLLALGSMNPAIRQLRAVSVPFLHQLSTSTGWSANLAVLSGNRALLIEEIYCAAQLPPKMIGATFPLHASAIGKALLGWLPAATFDLLIGDGLLRPHTRNTIVRPSVLRTHLADARAAGVAMSREEWRLGACGVAAPVMVDGEPIAAVGLVGPPDDRTMRTVISPVRRVAAELGRRLSPQADLAAA